ncbi:hypothetical protein C6P45_002673 [Maudiozyma exigua]|uniref:PA14 domain-containing protein n=1 Tax=Maudiozyma exigua TaxID=34358 RepID=A0A9P6WDM2_MAUEX|nr:hypothetical protein C6P45_002673 [Kazachstania exigua]
MLLILKFALCISALFKFVLGQGTDLTPDSTHSCRIPEDSTFIDGFRARFYPYLHPQYTYEYDNHDYLLNLYSTLNKPLTTIYGIYDVNYVYTGPNAYNGPQWGLLHGYNVTLTNFTIEYVGYFIPQKTGSYTFSFDNTDDSALLFFANPSAFRCCNADADIKIDESDVSIDAIDQWATGAPSTVTHTLQEGVAYPMRIVYYNQGGIGKLHMTWKDPDGVTHDTFDNYVTFFTDLETECAHEIVTQTTSFEPGTATETTTYTTLVSTFTGDDDVVTTETIYVVQTPDSRTHTETATTVYTEGTGTETATYSTATGVYTGTDGILTTETTFFVENPGPETTITAASTTTEFISSGEPTTETVITTFLTTESDDEEEEVVQTDIHEIMIPTIDITFNLEFTTTEFLSTVSVPTTITHITTYLSTDDDGEEEEVIETDVEVELPSAEETITTAQTTTGFGSATVPTTETHVTTFYTTDDEGNEEEIIETDVEVELPSVEETVTTVQTATEFGSVTFPTTTTHVTTYYSTNEDGEEEEIIETEVEVELPSVEETVTTATTVYSEGDVTKKTTISTILSTFYTTGSEGNEEEVIETEFVVEIPDVDETITIATTEYTNYPGSVPTTLTHITTFFTTDANGNEDEIIETEVIVETLEHPESAIDAEDLEVATSEEEEIFTASTGYTYYRGSVTSTYSTKIRTYITTDANGNEEEVVETDYFVKIPETTSSITLTQDNSQITKQSKVTTSEPNRVEQETSAPTIISQQTVQSPLSSSSNISQYEGSGSLSSSNIVSSLLCLLFAALLT